MDFSLPHTETFDAFFVRDGKAPIQNLEAARGKKIVAMRSDAAHHELMDRKFQGELVLVDTIPQGLAMVAGGSGDAFLCSKLIGVLAIREHGIHGLSAGPPVPDYKRVFSFGIRKGDDDLREKLNQGLLIVKSSGEYDRIYEKWLSIDDPLFRYRKHFLPILIIALGICFAALITSVTLKRMVSKRTNELVAKNLELEHEITVRQRTEEELNIIQKNLERLVAERTRALADSEELYRLTLTNISDAVFVTDDEGVFTFVCSNIDNILGYSVEQVFGLGNVNALLGTDLFDPEKLVADGEIHDIGREVVDGQGNSRTVLVSVRLVSIKEGRRLYVCRDVSERERLIQQRSEMQQRLEIALEGGVIGIWDWYIDTGELYQDKYWLKQLGYSEGEVEQRIESWSDRIHPEDKPKVMEMLDGHLRGDLPAYAIEHRLLTKSGEWRWIFTSGRVLKHDDSGKPLRMLGTHLDIHTRKLSEEKLRQSEERYRTVADFTYDWEYWAGSDGVLLYVSPSCERITGYSADEFMNDPGLIHKIIHPGESAEVTDHFRSVPSSSDPEFHTFDFRIVNRDGTTRWLNHVCQRIHGNNGNALGRRASNRDITDRKNLETQLLQAQKMEAVGTLAGGIAHDFNNLLQVIFGYSQLILMNGQLSENDRDSVAKIHQAGERGADLVKGLLLFSRKVEPELTSVDLNHEIVQMQKLLFHTLPKTIKIELRPTVGTTMVSADKSQMGQILMNLCINSKDAMPEGGILTIGTTNVELDDQDCAINPNLKPGPHVVVTVSDNGCGMDKKTLSRIFEPFFTTKEVGQGTGLGLATVYAIVRQHSGHIHCYSEPSHGTTFKIYLPAIPSEQKPDETAQREPITGGTETILVVDDEDSIRNLAVTLLQHFGYEVIEASNGKEAVEIYRRDWEKIALVVLDLIMPEMDGKRCLKEIHKINPKAKVIIVSGQIEQRQNGIKSDTVRGFIGKPYDARTFMKEVRYALDGA